MKEKFKWIILAVVFIAIIAGAAILYPKLEKIYKPEAMEEPTTEQGEQENNSYAAPDFTILDQEGKEVKLSDFKGRPIVLNFWATWCHYCKEEMPDFNTAAENYPEVQFLMVNATDGVQETKEKAEKYVAEQKFTFDVFFDTKLEAVNNYFVTGFPATFFIDADGNLVTRASGRIDYATLVKGIGMITEE